jgi:hypothetical protein
MAAPFNANFNPMNVSLQGGDQIKGPYLQTGDQRPTGNPGMKTVGTSPLGPQKPAGNPGMKPGVVGAQAVRATGQGPYDPAFRQDLATYAGGQFSRPGGNLSFNPTGQLPAGLGANNSLLSQALGGQAFSFAPPKPKQPVKKVGRTMQPGDQDPGNWRGYGHGMFGGQ